MRAVGQSEMRQLLSTLNVNCIPVKQTDTSQPTFEEQTVTVKSGWLFKKSEKKAGIHTGKAWQRRWFVLTVTSEPSTDGMISKTANLTYYHSQKETKDGVEIPLKEAMSVKTSIGKTKGTEHRLTLNTPKREWELGSGEETTAKEWDELLQQWIGLPKLERLQRASQVGEATVVKSQWMEVRVDVYKPDEISDEELSRSNTIQKSVSSFSRTFTLSGRKKKKEEEEAKAQPEPSGLPDDAEDEEDEEAAFTWVYVTLMTDHTLRQYENESMTNEIGRLHLGYLIQAAMVDASEGLELSYEHAFRVKPESATADSWVCCPDSAQDSQEWIAVLKA